MRSLIPLGWFPMVVPGTRYVTVGGAIASDIHGKFRHGSFCDYVERFQLVTPAHGTIAVGRETHPDEFWSTAGGMGLTGIITEATLRLQPVETALLTVDTERATDVDDCMARMLDNDERYRYSVAWIDCIARGRHLGRSVLTRGNHTTLDELPAARRAHARRFQPISLGPAPPIVPAGLLNPLLDPGVQRDVVPQVAARPRRPHPDDHRLLPSARRRCATGTASTGRAGSCSISTSCPTVPKRWCERPSNGSARQAALRSSRC